MIGRFEWEQTPADAFEMGYDTYDFTVASTLYTLMQQEAGNIQDFMRREARWEDTQHPEREYLVAEAFFIPDTSTGIEASYNLEAVDRGFPFAMSHEGIGMANADSNDESISIISDHGIYNSVLGTEARRVWDEVRVLFT